MTDFEIRTTARQHTAAIRMTRPVSQIGPAMSEAFPKIYHAVVSSGVEPAGEPLAVYHEMSSEEATFECAIPVPEPFTAVGEVEASSVGGSEVAFGVHKGPYDTIGQTWEAIMGWIVAQGRTPAGHGWEVYIDDPQEVDSSELRTELYVPVV